MLIPFFDRPIRNSPYQYPNQHWELDETGQPTRKIINSRRTASFVTPIPKPRKRKGKAEPAVQGDLFTQELSTEQQTYDHTALINAVRMEVDKWRRIPGPNDWRVTPETARLLQYWRHHHRTILRTANRPFKRYFLSKHRLENRFSIMTGTVLRSQENWKTRA